MDFEWDPRKAAENLRKYGVDFADAVITLEDENALTIEDRDHPEQRLKTLGLGPDLKVLFFVHAERNENLIRIISARYADRSQTKQYYQGLSYE
ncbi:MAG: BrnT family toxin [Candidatus Thiodiazotropha endolucinida]|nr:BrnT family toxin [Candidatus Thiodiazotropha taylori]MCG8094309.1 BrnT family toxin [Candidatus Thiodiazotropha endolucinida]MCG8049272.1 BrnT family toxin [Candidatus Thiodiazotropha taylori]MCG8062060.1 BrnT family toxin [Candidatus Thiodiazotropha taylori]MCG8101698.1 BrnT family toxin [Candidatus Thiodiazotropha taylori]